MAEFASPNMANSLVLGKVPDDCKPVVVGIDFGTAYSGVAFAYKADPDSVQYGAPTATEKTQVKVPTAILLKDDGSWEFGNVAISQYTEMLMAQLDGEPLKAHLYKRFKMVLKDQQEGFDSLQAVSVAGKRAPLMDLVVKCITKLKQFAVDTLLSGYGTQLDPANDVQWVLTVPAIWNDFGKAFMRKAAFKAGLMTTEQSDNLMLVLEPEGASLAVHVGAAEHGLLGTGSRFLVLDCGGGTVDITSHEVTSVSPLQMKSISVPCGGKWGGDYVNEEFKKFLMELLGENLYREDENPYEFYSINCEFDTVKILFDPAKDPNNIRLIDVLDDKKQLVELAEAYNAKHPDTPILMNPTLRNGFLTMSKALMMSFFEPFLAASVEETKKVMKDVTGIKHVMVVGGFGSSRVLIDRIKTEFHNKGGVRVLLPVAKPKPQGAIAHGAVYYGLYKELIQSRVAAYTYGVAMRINGVDDVFSILVSKGEELPADHEAFLMGLPITPEQDKISWRIFRSENPEPTTVVGEHQLGVVTALCPHNSEPSKRKQTGLYKFGGSEIRVTIENAQGDKFEGEISMI